MVVRKHVRADIGSVVVRLLMVAMMNVVVVVAVAIVVVGSVPVMIIIFLILALVLVVIVAGKVLLLRVTRIAILEITAVLARVATTFIPPYGLCSRV